ncbi:DUF1566 domain-containing protein [Microbulbifer elongatus]|uniref:DUF1566 domain-containing protein n=1 Tax=Microbulbifer elongatus TaxID=86173 RepID=A0ABT1P3S9_9GAMM|nr:DUF1566 domain-containing protein [Microbulbifer elongatus]MCQ3830177.1 DUF1566 domain-containing protein [Microbulbifer elongatus]
MICRNKTAQILALALAIAGLSSCTESGRESPPPVRLNDTGITWGADYPRGVNVDCTASVDLQRLPDGESLVGDILSQQDCNQGRDAAGHGSADGAAGFAYRKIGAGGEPLPADAQNWHCVADEITGLAWEVKQPGDGVYGNRGRHDADDVFTWYNPDNSANAGAIGDWNSRYAQCTGYVAGQPATYCNIEEYVSRTNRRGLCGFDDWRVPTMDELSGLVHFGRSAPAIDTNYFPNTKVGFYWSHSPDAELQQRAWAVNFQFGYSAPMPRNNGHHLRLVRDWAEKPEENAINPAPVPALSTAQGCNREQIPSSAPSSRYQLQEDGSVADTETGLIWRACMEGVAGEACDQGEPLALNWAEALTYATALDKKGAASGDDDWRLPNIRELGSLLELQCAGPAINRGFFPNAAQDVWSSSPSNFHTHYSWYVDFATGALTYGEREKPKAIRLVRDAR